MTDRLVAVTRVIALFASGCMPPWAGRGDHRGRSSRPGGHVVELREAIKVDSATAAQDVLSELRRDARLRATAGDITGKRLARIEAAADEVERFLSQLEPEPDVFPALTPQALPHPKPTPQLTVPPSPRATPTPPVAPSANATSVPSLRQARHRQLPRRRGERHPRHQPTGPTTRMRAATAATPTLSDRLRHWGGTASLRRPRLLSPSHNAEPPRSGGSARWRRSHHEGQPAEISQPGSRGSRSHSRLSHAAEPIRGRDTRRPGHPGRRSLRWGSDGPGRWVGGPWDSRWWQSCWIAGRARSACVWLPVGEWTCEQERDRPCPVASCSGSMSAPVRAE